jgi:hypothetical protein
MADVFLVIHRNMQITARDADVGMARGVSDFGQRPAVGKGVADKSVPAVMDGQRFEPSGTENAARGPESLAKCLAGECFDSTAGNQRRQERLVVFGAEANTIDSPSGQIFRRPSRAEPTALRKLVRRPPTFAELL